MQWIAENHLSLVQYAQALALDWHVMFSAERYMYAVMLTRDCVHRAGQDTCDECKVIKVRSRAFVRKRELSGQLAIPNIFGGSQ